MAASITIKDAQAKNWASTLIPDASRARVEIEEFLGDNDLTNLYLLALEAMQKEDATKSVAQKNDDWWTFYSLSGIHGLPAENWDGVRDPLTQSGNGGYCTHGAVVFPTWHRVYINMFEQAVSNKIQEIADLFTKEPERSIYQTAAKRFRLPFWDPYLPRNKVAQTTATVNEKIWGVPKILAAKQVWVKRPGKTALELVSNPLYAFNFSNKTLQAKHRAAIPWSQVISELQLAPNGGSYTIRSPGDDGETNNFGIDDGDRAGLDLKIQRQAVTSVTKLWKLLSPYAPHTRATSQDQAHNNDVRSWSSFATHNVVNPRTDKPRVDADGKPVYNDDTAVSLESWHDTIHGLIGTGGQYSGHMGSPSIAGFDPIFWLHHCNVDRLLAIYQALYPDRWLKPSDASANLYPFRKNATLFWTSNDVRDWTTLGYAIPGNKQLDEAGRQALGTYLHEYYNWTTVGSVPPNSVSKDWPRDLSKSTALNGILGHSVANSIVSFQALEKSKLVTRRVTVPTTDSPIGTVADQPKTVIIQDNSANTKVTPPETVKSGKMLTWNARIQVKKFALNGSFNIHLFIGKIEDDQTSRFLTKKNEVGYTTVFASAPSAPCANCDAQREAKLLYEDAIPITPSLFAYLKSNTVPEADGPLLSLRTLENFEPEQVVLFLKENLAWRVTDMASRMIVEGDLADSGLQVSVSVREYELPTVEKPLGVYHPAEVRREITEGKFGGFGYAPAA